MRYAVVIEQAGNNYSAHVPDLPGCIAAAVTKSEVEILIHEAIGLHLRGLCADGAVIPQPSSQTEDCQGNSKVKIQGQ